MMRFVGRFAGMMIGFAMGAASAQAGKETGNGGDAIVCHNALGHKSVELYDHYEATARHGLAIDLGKARLPVEDKLAIVFDRLDRINPGRANLYRSWFSKFYQEAEFLRGVTLIDIPDTGDGYIPSNCKLEQAAVQRVPKFPGEKRYTINQDIWDWLDNDARAGLILHELVFREARSQRNPHGNSINVRYLNTLLSSTAVEKMKLREYIELLLLLEIEQADAQGGVPIVLWSSGASGPAKVTFHSDDLVESALTVGQTEYAHEWRGLKLRANVGYGTSESTVRFHPTGVIASEINLLPQGFSFKAGMTDVRVDVVVGAGGFSWGSLSFHPDGKARKVSGSGGVQFALPVFKGACRSAEFHPSGNPMSCEVAITSQVFLNGSWRTVYFGNVELADDGSARIRDGSTVEVASPVFEGRCESARFSPGGDAVRCESGSVGRIRVSGIWTPVDLSKSAFGGSWGVLEFTPAGELEVIDGAVSYDLPGFRGTCGTSGFATGGNLSSCGYSILFSPSGGRNFIFVQGQWLETEYGEEIEFHDSGAPKSAYLTQGATLKTATGASRAVYPRTKVQFDAQGWVP